MSVSSPSPLLNELEKIVQRDRPGRSLETVERTPLARGSSRWIEALNLRLDDGSVWPLVLKDLRREMPGSESGRIKPRRVVDPDREPWVYRHLLRDHPAGVPRSIDFVSEEAEPGWILLEAVQGLPLSEVGEDRPWRSAAAWLGRFHAWSGGDRGLERAPLLHHSQELHEWWRNRARESLADRTPGGREEIEVLEEAHTLAVRIAFGGATSLIHGEFYASNILWEPQHGGRVRPVDWEMAAFGPSLLDLAALITGRWGEPAATLMIRAYRHSRLAGGGVCAPLDHFLRGLTACRLLLAVQWLGWNSEWVPPAEHRTDWWDEARHCATELLGDDR